MVINFIVSPSRSDFLREMNVQAVELNNKFVSVLLVGDVSPVIITFERPVFWCDFPLAIC